MQMQVSWIWQPKIPKDVYGFAVGVIGSRAAVVNGVQVGITTVAEKMNGLQVGLFNNSGFEVVLLSGLLSSFTGADRLYVGEVNGLQLGITNGGSLVRGLQLGFENGSERLTGLQCGVLNFSNDVRGAQLGFINTASARMTGLQMGLLNVVAYEEVNGVQLGIINLQEREDDFNKVIPLVHFKMDF